MKIAYLATFPPRECGIGTFTKNLYTSISDSIENNSHIDESYIIALNDNGKNYDYPPAVKFTIQQDVLADYLKAATFINDSGAQLCIVQHEFGIFGGNDGNYILPFLYRLNTPIIITFHTVLKNPSQNQRTIIEKIGGVADKIVVMSHKAIGFLRDIYNIPNNKIALIEHGVPGIRFKSLNVKKELGLMERRVILTFGLLGRSKGIEVVLKALPGAIESHPEILYIVLGKTHPHVVRDSGEEYRNFLKELVKELELENHVLFIDHFIDQQNLFKYLYACDIYISPYLNEAQITSGTLSYAVGVGAAVISTPYWHATELLSDGMGRLFNFEDSRGLTSILLDVLNNPPVLKEMKEKAKAYSRKITWPKIGEKYHQLSISLSKSVEAASPIKIPIAAPKAPQGLWLHK